MHDAIFPKNPLEELEKNKKEAEQRLNSDEEQSEIQMEQTPPTPPPPSHKKLIIGIVVAVFVVAGSVGAYFFVNQRDDTGLVACTADAKICPDGSAVGRTGPNCEFAECPADVTKEGDVNTQTLNEPEYVLRYDNSYWKMEPSFKKAKLFILKGQTLPEAGEAYGAGPLFSIRNVTRDRIEALRNEFETIYEMTIEDGYEYSEQVIDNINVIIMRYPALSWGGDNIEYFYEKKDGTYLSISHYPFEEGSTSTKQFYKILDSLEFK